MARDHARIRVDLLTDEDFRGLRAAEQHLYLLALASPLLSNAGVVPYTARRWSHSADDLTPNSVRKTIAGLVGKRFVVVDEDTEELFIRTFVKHDGLIYQPNVAKNMADSYKAIVSRPIRFAFLAELHRLRHSGLTEDAKGWTEPKVEHLMAEGFPEGLAEGFTEPFVQPLREGLPIPRSCACTRVCGRAPAAPAPAPSPSPAPGVSATGSASRPVVGRRCFGCQMPFGADGSCGCAEQDRLAREA